MLNLTDTHTQNGPIIQLDMLLKSKQVIKANQLIYIPKYKQYIPKLKKIILHIKFKGQTFNYCIKF